MNLDKINSIEYTFNNIYKDNKFYDKSSNTDFYLNFKHLNNIKDD